MLAAQEGAYLHRNKPGFGERPAYTGSAASKRRQAALLGRSLAYRVQVSGMDAAARIAAADRGPAVLPREAVESCMCRLPA